MVLEKISDSLLMPGRSYMHKALASYLEIDQFIYMKGRLSEFYILLTGGEVKFAFIGNPERMRKDLNSIELPGSYHPDMPLTNRVLYNMRNDLSDAEGDIALVVRTSPKDITPTAQLKKLFERINDFRQEQNSPSTEED